MNDLENLKAQIESAIAMSSVGLMVGMTEAEKKEHWRVFGRGRCVGDYVIFKRSEFFDWSNTDPANSH